MKKIAVAITGASGAIYASLLLKKLELLKDQCAEVSVVMSNNATFVWQTELGNDAYKNFPFRYFEKTDFTAPFASGSLTTSLGGCSRELASVIPLPL